MPKIMKRIRHSIASRAEDDHAANGENCERSFMPAESALLRLGEAEKIALLHGAMDSFDRALHEQRVAERQPHILEVLAQIFSLPMNGKNKNAVALPKIQVAQCLAEKGGTAPDNSFHENRSALAGGLDAEVRLGLKNNARRFLNPLRAGDGRFEQKLIALKPL